MMSSAPFVAAVVGQQLNLPDDGGASWVFWLLGVGVILGLWWVIARTRKRSYDAYWERRKRDEQRRADDPDMAKPDDESSGGT